MFAYAVKRVLLFVPILFGVATVTFFLVYVLPGDPVLSMVGERYDEETIQRLRAECDRVFWEARGPRGAGGAAPDRSPPRFAASARPRC